MTIQTVKAHQKHDEKKASELAELFTHQLQDIYFAENAIMKALPKLIDSAHSDELRKGFQKHLEQTHGQIDRLDRVFGTIGEKAEAAPCEAIKGILKEGDEIAKRFGKTVAGDAALAAAAQTVEHYEIARYGALMAWAKKLDYREAASLLGQTLEEEIETDEALTQLAEKQLNSAAMGRS
jgi:ferritin-like metal-binding protein YciE